MRVLVGSMVVVLCGGLLACGGSATDDVAPSSAGAGGSAGTGGASPGGAAGSSTGGSSGAAAGSSGAANLPPLPQGEPYEGCDGAALLKVAGDDPGARGPWPVGARTVTVSGLTVEVLYPASIGSETTAGSRARYDVREHLPDADAAKIPDAKNPWQECDCYRELPIDDAHGPYPVVLFVHGTAAFRTQSLTQMTHWASRGFVVLSADHPKIRLKDALGNLLGVGGADQVGDGKKILAALSTQSDGLAFLAGRVAPQRLAVSGHSAGGGAASGLANEPGVKVVMPMAAQGVKSTTGTSNLILGGMSDGIAAFSGQQKGFASTPKRKRLIGLTNAGHLAFSDLCFLGRDGGGILQIALDSGVMVNPLVANLAQDGCKVGQLPAEEGWKIIDYATSAVLEETLMCNGAMTAAIAATKAKFADVGEFAEEL